jgi:hypothetical protein
MEPEELLQKVMKIITDAIIIGTELLFCVKAQACSHWLIDVEDPCRCCVPTMRIRLYSSAVYQAERAILKKETNKRRIPRTSIQPNDKGCIVCGIH